MAKTNFSKVEWHLDKAQHQRQVDNLLDLASLASNVGKGPKSEVSTLWSSRLHSSLIWISKKNPKILEDWGVDLDRILDRLDAIEEQDENHLKILEDLNTKVSEYKRKLEKEHPEDYNEKLIEEERDAHINKRHNVKKGWLPLK